MKQHTQTERTAPTPYGPPRRPWFGQYRNNRGRLREIVQRFRQKGATSPEKAMTIQELGLPPRFKEAMHRKLGQSGIFVEVHGKYYLNEERLKEIQEQRAKRRSGSGGGSDGSRIGPSTWFRVVGILLILPIDLIIALLLHYFFAFKGGLFSGEFLLIFVIVFLALAVFRLLFWRSSRRYWRVQWLAG